MRIAISHNQSKGAVMAAIDGGIEDALRTLKTAPVEIADLQKSWTGSTLSFSFNAKVGFLKSSVTGTVEVSDAEVVITVDPGMLGRLFPEEKAQQAIAAKIRGLLA